MAKPAFEGTPEIGAVVIVHQRRDILDQQFAIAQITGHLLKQDVVTNLSKTAVLLFELAGQSAFVHEQGGCGFFFTERAGWSGQHHLLEPGLVVRFMGRKLR